MMPGYDALLPSNGVNPALRRQLVLTSRPTFVTLRHGNAISYQ
jgi:hypothetical protein